MNFGVTINYALAAGPSVQSITEIIIVGGLVPLQDSPVPRTDIRKPTKPSDHGSPLITPILRQALGQSVEFRQFALRHLPDHRLGQFHLADETSAITTHGQVRAYGQALA